MEIATSGAGRGLSDVDATHTVAHRGIVNARRERRAGRAPATHRSLWTLFGMVVTLATALLGADARYASGAELDSWPGWRGLDKEGVSHRDDAPINWTVDDHIAWRTPLPGAGHSSPVVAGDRVFVTATYMSVAHIRQALRMAVVGAAALAALFGARIALNHLAPPPAARMSLRWSVANALFWLLLALQAAIVLIGDSVFDYQRVAIRGWLVNGGLLAVSCWLACFYTSGRRWTWAMLSAISLVVAAFMVVGGQGHLTSSAVEKKALLFSLPAVLLIGVALCLRWSRAPDAAYAPTKATAMDALRVVAALFSLVAILCGLALALLGNSEYLTYQLRDPRWAPVGGWVSVAVVAGSGLIGALWGLRDQRRSSTSGPVWRIVFRAAILTVGLGAFLTENFVSARYLPTQSAQALICLDADTGEILWTCEGLRAPLENLHTFNSPATPTPVAAQGRVVAYFGTAGLFCTDLEGRLLWVNDDLPFRTINGVGSSPTAFGDVVLLVGDQPEGSYLAAVDLFTGRTLWKKARPGNQDFGCGVSRTPIVKDIDGTPTAIVWGFEDVTAYDARTGDELWVHQDPALAQHCMVSSLVSDSQRIYLGSPTRAAALSLAPDVRSSNRELWSERVSGCNCSSPVLANGLLFMASDNGVLTCLDAETGKRLWRHRLPGRYFASPVVAGDKLYLCNDSGLTTVLRVARKAEVLAENDLVERVQASPAAVGNRMFIRTDRHLYCIQ